MPETGKQRYLLCYDISCPRRLVRVHRRVKTDGLPLQKSVFEMTLTAAQLRTLIADISLLISPKHDDVRIYGLSSTAEALTFGRQTLPDGVLLFNN